MTNIIFSCLCRLADWDPNSLSIPGPHEANELTKLYAGLDCIGSQIALVLQFILEDEGGD